MSCCLETILQLHFEIPLEIELDENLFKNRYIVYLISLTAVSRTGRSPTSIWKQLVLFSM